MSQLIFAFITLLVGSFILGPGFGVASAMSTWYALAYRKKIFRRWPVFGKMDTTLLGTIVTTAVIVVDVILLVSLGWLVHGSMNTRIY